MKIWTFIYLGKTGKNLYVSQQLCRCKMLLRPLCTLFLKIDKVCCIVISFLLSVFYLQFNVFVESGIRLLCSILWLLKTSRQLHQLDSRIVVIFLSCHSQLINITVFQIHTLFVEIKLQLKYLRSTVLYDCMIGYLVTGIQLWKKV